MGQIEAKFKVEGYSLR